MNEFHIGQDGPIRSRLEVLTERAYYVICAVCAGYMGAKIIAGVLA